jgi:hypothetical protein
MNKHCLGLAAALVGLAAIAAALTPAAAQVPVPIVTAVGPNDLFHDIQNGAIGPANSYATGAQLGVYGFTLGGANADNALIGGDFYQNQWARGTTSATINTTAAYGPNNWFLWSGTSTNLVATQQTGAADITNGFLASARVTRSSTGVVQSCIAQEVESSIAERFQGGTAEFDFHALAGAGFSDAAAALHAYIITGTATDEGSSKMAFSINAGGGGGSGWTGAAVLGGTAGYTVPITAVWGRYSVVAPIPAAAKEIGVALCWTPVGASPSNDYFEFTGAQLVVNPALATVAGTAGAALALNDSRVRVYARRNIATEVAAQQRTLYVVNEAALTAGAAFAVGQTPTATTCTATVPFPVTARVAPTYANALTGSTFKLNSAAVNTALTTPFSATAGANSVSNGSVTFTAASLAATPGFACELVSVGGTGQLLFTSEL